MAISTQPAPPAPASTSLPQPVVEDRLWTFSVDQYHEMVRHGIIEEDAPVELLDGLLITKMGKNPAHRTAVELLSDALKQCVPEGWHVEAQNPLTLARSEPEPDAALVRGSLRDYRDRHPGAEDVAIVAEVGDTNLRQDRSLKKRLYAEAGLPVYWIVNLIDRQGEVYTAPTGPSELPDYTRQQTYRDDETVPVAIAGEVVAQLPVADLLP